MDTVAKDVNILDKAFSFEEVNSYTINRIREVFKAREPGPMDFAKEYSVMVLLAEIDGKLSFVFEQRAFEMCSQPREVCFPGGSVEEGETPLEGALREVYEEIGLKSDEIEVIKEFDTIYGYGYFILHTFIGFAPSFDFDRLKPSKDEVHKVFAVSLEEMDRINPIELCGDVETVIPEDFPYEMLRIKEDYKWRNGKWEIPVYLLEEENQVVWGLTARIVKKFLASLKED